MGQERTEFSIDGNDAILDATTRQPLSLDEALAKFKVDMETWDVERYIVNQWEQGMKGPDKEPIIVPLYQVKVFLKRRIAVTTEIPAITPTEVLINTAVIPRVRPSQKKIKTAVIIPDSQNGYRWDRSTQKLVPFHDRYCWEVGRQLVDDIKPDEIVFLGDMLDLPEWSDKFYRSPDFYFTTQPAILELAWWLGRYREASPKSVMVYLEGNHEKRMDTAVGSHLLAAHGLRAADEVDKLPALSVQKLLGLNSLKIKYCGPYPHGEYWLNSKVCATHGEFVGNNALQNTTDQFSRISFIGHLHRQEVVSKTVFTRSGEEVLQVCCPGTFAKLDGSVPAFKSRSNWQQGLAVVQYDNDGELYNLNPVLIEKGQMFYNGTLYQANDQVQRLRADTGWEYF